METGKPFYSIVVKIINLLSRIASVIVIVFLIAMMLLIVVDVSLRYFFNSPIPGSIELVQYFMIVGGFLGLSWCAVKNGHIKVGLVVDRFPARVQAIFSSVTLILGLTVAPLVTWRLFAQAIYEQASRTASDFLDIPAYPFYIAAGIGYGLFCLVLLTALVNSIIEASKK
jgi:TRAP-type C4-dicarboxylate transport system permease small subunit